MAIYSQLDSGVVLTRSKRALVILGETQIMQIFHRFFCVKARLTLR